MRRREGEQLRVLPSRVIHPDRLWALRVAVAIVFLVAAGPFFILGHYVRLAAVAVGAALLYLAVAYVLSRPKERDDGS